ncbi:MAG: phosphatase PAP2 family protein [Ignavibacteriaceae bacterium]|nr:phosphatase PAP2 family protein [Ignavibacteriaceae bacterium]
MKNYRFKFIILSLLSIFSVKQTYAQFYDKDTLFHPYHVNYWVTGSIIVGGLTLESIGVAWISNKSQISQGEISNLDRHDISPIDSWALNFNPSKRAEFEKLSSQLQTVLVFLPFVTLLDPAIRKDWLDILLMYLQTQAITNNFYLYSPFGATFQNRLRPVVYYDAVDIGKRTEPNNRNSLYSGHVAAASEACFFTAKIFCDYHPELGLNKYLVYAAATVPPLFMSYFRLRALAHFPTDIMVGFGVGALCGILVPEFHRIDDGKMSLGLYSNPEATGLAITWRTDFFCN